MPGQRARVVGAALRAHIRRAARLLTSEVVAELVAHTPVRTGWARANWIASTGAPADGPDGAPGSSSSSARDSALAQVIAGYEPTHGVIFVTNRVPYIRSLNEGSSAQAPAAFVEQAVAAATQKASAKLAVRAG